MTKEQVLEKIKEIIAKDARFKDAQISVIFNDKSNNEMNTKKPSKER